MLLLSLSDKFFNSSIHAKRYTVSAPLATPIPVFKEFPDFSLTQSRKKIQLSSGI